MCVRQASAWGSHKSGNIGAFFGWEATVKAMNDACSLKIMRKCSRIVDRCVTVQGQVDVLCTIIHTNTVFGYNLSKQCPPLVYMWMCILCMYVNIDLWNPKNIVYQLESFFTEGNKVFIYLFYWKSKSKTVKSDRKSHVRYNNSI